MELSHLNVVEKKSAESNCDNGICIETNLLRRSISVQKIYKIGIVGYGKLGQYLVEHILQDAPKYQLQLVFIWNRTSLSNEIREQLLQRCSSVQFLEALEQIKNIEEVDLIVEVCHPIIVHQYASLFLDKANFLMGSPTALAHTQFVDRLNEKLQSCKNRLFVARGSLWGANDIQNMARENLLQSVQITMHFHPRSLRLVDPYLSKLNEELMDGGEPPREMVLYEGPARELCYIAPNNVNTIATAAMLGLGFDQTIGRLIGDSNCDDYHRIMVEIRGKPTIDGKQFELKCLRQSPTHSANNVTSLQTYHSFWFSLLQCIGSFSRLNGLEVQIC